MYILSVFISNPLFLVETLELKDTNVINVLFQELHDQARQDNRKVDPGNLALKNFLKVNDNSLRCEPL